MGSTTIHASIVLPDGIRTTISPKESSYSSPNYSRHLTQEQQVRGCFQLVAKGATGVSGPSSFFHIISSQNGILPHLP